MSLSAFDISYIVAVATVCGVSSVLRSCVDEMDRRRKRKPLRVPRISLPRIKGTGVELVDVSKCQGSWVFVSLGKALLHQQWDAIAASIGAMVRVGQTVYLVCLGADAEECRCLARLVEPFKDVDVVVDTARRFARGVGMKEVPSAIVTDSTGQVVRSGYLLGSGEVE
jgi:hypothetical protein